MLSSLSRRGFVFLDPINDDRWQEEDEDGSLQPCRLPAASKSAVHWYRLCLRPSERPCLLAPWSFHVRCVERYIKYKIYSVNMQPELRNVQHAMLLAKITMLVLACICFELL